MQRTFKFAKYLPEYDWRVTVLTVQERGYFAKDNTLLEELNQLPIGVVRTASLDPWFLLRKKNVVSLPSAGAHNLLSKISQFFLVPDNKVGWKKHALEAARQLFKEQDFDTIYATAPPYTDFLIGAELKKEFGLPLILDYRDAWLENPLHMYATPFHRMRHRQLEASVLRSADHIITINRRLKESLIKSYDFLDHSDVSIISQGYDAEDFDYTPPPKRKKFRITHAGTFYYNRTPKYFLLALKQFLEHNPGAKNDIEACFVGTWRESDTALVKKLGLEGVVVTTGYKPHNECVSILLDSDALWMMIGNGKGDEMMSTGKLYEYLGAQKPILACVPDGVARQVLDKSQAAFIAAPDDVSGIYTQITALYKLHKSGRLPTPSNEFVQQFERRALTEQLARILARATHIGPPESNVVREP